MNIFEQTGWQPDLTDRRDFYPEHAEITKLLSAGGERANCEESQVDLTEYFPEADKQTVPGVSAVHAALSLYEYFERRANGVCIRLSRRFLWLVCQKEQQSNFLGLRSVLKTLARVGSPPERHVRPQSLDLELLNDPFLYSYSPRSPYLYFRLDQLQTRSNDIVRRIRNSLQAGFPVIAGFSVPDCLGPNGVVEYRPLLNSVAGGQAIVIVGYDDGFASSCIGAFRIRCSWGSSWGDNGYGWLPYRYFEERLALDAWTIISQNWMQSGEFSVPDFQPLRLVASA